MKQGSDEQYTGEDLVIDVIVVLILIVICLQLMAI